MYQNIQVCSKFSDKFKPHNICRITDYAGMMSDDYDVNTKL